MVYNLNKLMNWEEFKCMPKDLQKQYLLKLKENGATQKDVADMFGIGNNTMSGYCKNHDMQVFPHRGGKSREATIKWDTYLSHAVEQTDEAQEQQPEALVEAEQPAEAVQQPQVAESAQPEANVPYQPRMKCQTTFTMHCTGPFNIYDFVMELGKFIDEGQPVDITLTGIINPD